MIVSKINKITTNADRPVPPVWFGYLLNQAALRIRAMTGAALAALDLTPPQLRALEAISDHQPLNQTQLGELVNMDRSTIVHVIDHFEALGVAARHAEPSDRRTHAVMLTPSGKHLLARARASARAVEDQFLAPLSQTQRAALQNTLQQLFDPSPCPEEKKRESRTPPSHPR